MPTATPTDAVLATDFDQILERLTGPAFFCESDGVLYIKRIEGTSMTLDQWLELKRDRIHYTSRLMQLDEAHPSYPVQAEYRTELPLHQAVAMANSWVAEAQLTSQVRDLQRTIDSYRRDA